MSRSASLRPSPARVVVAVLLAIGFAPLSIGLGSRSSGKNVRPVVNADKELLHFCTAGCWSADRKMFAAKKSYVDGKAILIWETNTWKLRAELRTAPRPMRGEWIRALCWAADGRHLFFTSHAGDLHCWDVDTHKEAFKIKASGGDRIEVSPDGRYVVTNPTARLIVFDASTGKEVRSFDDFAPHTATSIVFAANGLLACSSRRRILIGRLDSERGWKTIDKGALHLCFSPDGKTLATSFGDIFETATGKVRHRFDAGASPRLVYSKCGKYLAFRASTSPCRLVLWDINARKETYSIPWEAVLGDVAGEDSPYEVNVGLRGVTISAGDVRIEFPWGGPFDNPATSGA